MSAAPPPPAPDVSQKASSWLGIYGRAGRLLFSRFYPALINPGLDSDPEYKRHLSAAGAAATLAVIGITAVALSGTYSVGWWIGLSILGTCAIVITSSVGGLRVMRRERERAAREAEAVRATDPTFRDVERVRAERAQFEQQWFQRNLAAEFALNAFHWNGISVFEDGSYWFAPRVNVLLGKNGYGKTILFRTLIAMLQRDGEHGVLLFNSPARLPLPDNGEPARLRVEVTRDGEPAEIVRDSTYFLDTAGTPPVGKIPLLAIPDSRFLNRTRRTVSGAASTNESLASSGARNYLTQEPYENVIQDFLTQLCIDYLEPVTRRDRRRGGFDRYIFRLVEEVVGELIKEVPEEPGDDRSRFRFAAINRIGTSGFEILVRTAGSQDIPIPIQSASQGTLSVVAIFGLIFSYLHALRPDLPEDAVPTVPGIVVIDEIDAHLHPSWQQKILEMLTRRFQNVQFIISAHSPAIVAGCDQNEVSVLRKKPETGRFYVETLPEDFLGASMNDLYKRIFEIEEVDRLYLEFTTKSLMPPEQRERDIAELSKNPKPSRQDEARLDYLLRETRLVERAEQAREQRLKMTHDETHRAMLDAELARLKRKLDLQDAELERLRNPTSVTPGQGEDGARLP
jgi:ABC-type multidrug transport system ATPase subunit